MALIYLPVLCSLKAEPKKIIYMQDTIQESKDEGHLGVIENPIENPLKTQCQCVLQNHLCGKPGLVQDLLKSVKNATQYCPLKDP